MNLVQIRHISLDRKHTTTSCHEGIIKTLYTEHSATSSVERSVTRKTTREHFVRKCKESICQKAFNNLAVYKDF